VKKIELAEKIYERFVKKLKEYGSIILEYPSGLETRGYNTDPDDFDMLVTEALHALVEALESVFGPAPWECHVKKEGFEVSFESSSLSPITYLEEAVYLRTATGDLIEIYLVDERETIEDLIKETISFVLKNVKIRRVTHGEK